MMMMKITVYFVCLCCHRYRIISRQRRVQSSRRPSYWRWPWHMCAASSRTSRIRCPSALHPACARLTRSSHSAAQELEVTSRTPSCARISSADCRAAVDDASAILVPVVTWRTLPRRRQVMAVVRVSCCRGNCVSTRTRMRLGVGRGRRYETSTSTTWRCTPATLTTPTGDQPPHYVTTRSLTFSTNISSGRMRRASASRRFRRRRQRRQRTMADLELPP